VHKPSADAQTTESVPPRTSAAGPRTLRWPECFSGTAAWASLIAFMSSAPFGSSIEDRNSARYRSVPIFFFPWAEARLSGGLFRIRNNPGKKAEQAIFSDEGSCPRETSTSNR
jgi:hypothetical protein